MSDENRSPIVEKADEFREVMSTYIEHEVDDPLAHLDRVMLGLYSSVVKYMDQDWCEGRHLLGDALMYIEHFAALCDDHIPVEYWKGVPELPVEAPHKNARSVGDTLTGLVEDHDNGVEVDREMISDKIGEKHRGDFWSLTQFVYHECFEQRWDMVDIFEEAQRKIEGEMDDVD